MTDITELRRNSMSFGTGLAIGTTALCAATLIFWLAHSGAAARTVFEQQRVSEMASESRALCEKWGARLESPAFNECLADIQTVRDRHEQRIRDDEEPL